MATDILEILKGIPKGQKDLEDGDKMLAKALSLKKKVICYLLLISDGAKSYSENLATVNILVAKGELISTNIGWSLPTTGELN